MLSPPSRRSPLRSGTAITERKRPGGAFKVLVIGAGMTGVAAAIKPLIFPPPSGGAPVRVSYPFRLAP